MGKFMRWEVALTPGRSQHTQGATHVVGYVSGVSGGVNQCVSGRKSIGTVHRFYTFIRMSQVPHVERKQIDKAD